MTNGSSSPQIPLPYNLFLYREELRRHHGQFVKLSVAKLNLTDTLISHTIRNIGSYPTEEIHNMNRELLFKRRLRTKLRKIQKLHKLGLTDVDPNLISPTEL